MSATKLCLEIPEWFCLGVGRPTGGDAGVGSWESQRLALGSGLAGTCLAPAALPGSGLQRVPQVQTAPNSLGGAAASWQSQKSSEYVEKEKKQIFAYGIENYETDVFVIYYNVKNKHKSPQEGTRNSAQMV